MRLVRRLARPLVLVAVALLASGCGIRSDDGPRALSPNAVPFDLLAPSTTTTTTSPPSQLDRPVTVFLIDRDGYLAQVERQVRGEGVLRLALNELLADVTEDEAARGLRSAIPSSTELLGLDVDDSGLATIDLSDDLADIGGEGLRRALAQLVYTATAAERVDRVLFAFNGKLSEVPNGEGESTAEPLTRRDYLRYDPSRITTTTLPPPAPPPDGADPPPASPPPTA